MGDLSSAPVPPVGPDDHVRGPEGSARADRVRRLRVPVLRGARAAAGERAGARRVPPLPGPRRRIHARSRRPARRRPRRSRTRSGRCTTRCSPTRGGWRTRTCGRARRGSGSTWRASTPTAASTRSPRASAAQFRGGVRAGVPTTPTLFWEGERHAGRPDAELLARLANLRRVSARIPARARRHHRDRPPRTPRSSSACATDETGEAMRAFYRLYGGELFGFALNALGDRGAAEEIVQEVFLRAWRHAGTLRPAARGASAPGSTRSRATRSSTRAAAPPSARRCRARAGRGRHRGRRDRSSRRCSAGRSPRRSSGSRPEHRQMIRMAQFRGL